MSVVLRSNRSPCMLFHVSHRQRINHCYHIMDQSINHVVLVINRWTNPLVPLHLPHPLPHVWPAWWHLLSNPLYTLFMPWWKSLEILKPRGSISSMRQSIIGWVPNCCGQRLNSRQRFSRGCWMVMAWPVGEVPPPYPLTMSVRSYI